MARQDYIVGDSFRVTMQDGLTTIRHDGYDKALATIQRVYELYENTLKQTVSGCSDDLEMFLSDLREALDGEQE